MKTDIQVRDPAKEPIAPKVGLGTSASYCLPKYPSRFSRKKHFEGSPVSKYNENFTEMPEDV